MKLTEEERNILESVERGEWKCVAGLSEEKKVFEAAARTTLRKDKRVNIRMSERDPGKRVKWSGLPRKYPFGCSRKAGVPESGRDCAPGNS